MHLHIGSVYRTYGQVQEMAVRETALRSLLEDQKGELLHQSQSLQQVNADLAQNWTSVRSKQQELNALEDALAAGMLYTRTRLSLTFSRARSGRRTRAHLHGRQHGHMHVPVADTHTCDHAHVHEHA